MISPGLALLLQGLVSWAHGAATAPLSLVASALLLSAFIRHALRYPVTALIDLRLFRARVFRAAAATQFLSNALNFGGQLLLPLWFLQVRHATPSATGLMLFPLGLGIFCGLPTMGRLSERFGARAISGAGALLSCLGTVPFIFATGDTPYVLAWHRAVRPRFRWWIDSPFPRCCCRLCIGAARIIGPCHHIDQYLPAVWWTKSGPARFGDISAIRAATRRHPYAGLSFGVFLHWR